MARAKRILCLANSRKLNGRCVAGKEWADGLGGAWIRPVSAREHQEVSLPERQYEDRTEPRLLDIIKVPLLNPCPQGCQQENWRLDPGYYWERVGKADWRDLAKFTDPVGPLWSDANVNGRLRPDRIAEAAAAALGSSLRLIRIPTMKLFVHAPGRDFGNPQRRVKGLFEHAGRHYGFWVTDPVYEAAYLARSDGIYRLEECYLTISIGEAYDGYCYKLIAAIIEKSGGVRG